jgi:TolB protein
MRDVDEGRMALAFILLLCAGCGGPVDPPSPTPTPSPAPSPPCSSTPRADGACRLPVSLSGSLQNPAWSPDGASLVLTRFRSGYNTEPADLYVLTRATGATRVLVADGSGNVNLPGSSWNAATGKVVFSSSRDPHDEIFIIDAQGAPGAERPITRRANDVAFEPSLSPDGQWVVFESHALDVEDNGVITKLKRDGSGPYQALTAVGDDCRQPNWSPTGGLIAYQKYARGQWDIWVMSADGTGQRQLTSGSGDKTDASFSPDGAYLVYSSNEEGGDYANIFIVPVGGGQSTRVTRYTGYDGAPSWTNATGCDRGVIAFESYDGDPDGSAGTSLWLIEAPVLHNSPQGGA